MGGGSKRRGRKESGAIHWRLPEVRAPDIGKLGPAFGYGLGCGIGFGAGLVGGAGIGIGFPGLEFGVGFGAGCGVGIGFGYGLGIGRAYDENGRFSNLGKLGPRKESSITRADIGAIFEDMVGGLKRAIVNLDKNRKWGH